MKIIKNITKKGITYTENNNDFLISFEECNKNWLEYRKRKEKLSDIKLIETEKSDKTIGRRDVCANPPFIEFFTKPFTKFEFEQLPQNLNNKTNFSKLQNDIVNAGWNTIDLS